MDGDKQDSYDVFLKRIIVKNPDSQLDRAKSGWKMALLVFMLGFYICHFVSGTVTDGMGYWAMLILSLGFFYKILGLFGGPLVNQPIINH